MLQATCSWWTWGSGHASWKVRSSKGKGKVEAAWAEISSGKCGRTCPPSSTRSWSFRQLPHCCTPEHLPAYIFAHHTHIPNTTKAVSCRHDRIRVGSSPAKMRTRLRIRNLSLSPGDGSAENEAWHRGSCLWSRDWDWTPCWSEVNCKEAKAEAGAQSCWTASASFLWIR